MPRLTIRILAAICWCAFAAAAAPAAAPDAPRRILLIINTDYAYKWSTRVAEGILDYFRGQSKIHAEVDVFELDSAPDPDSGALRNNLPAALRQLREGDYDLVIAAGNEAADGLAEYAGALPKDLPVVFCAYADFEPERLAGIRNLTGVTAAADLTGTLEMGIRLFPEVRTVALIIEDSPKGREVRREVAGVLEQHPELSLVPIMVSKNDSAGALQAVKSLPPGYFLLVQPWQSVQPAALDSLRRTVANLSRSDSGPVLSTLDSMLGYKNVIGGVMDCGLQHGEETAKIAERILGGEAVETIPVTSGPTQIYLDWSKLSDFPIEGENLPEGVVFVNRPVSLWDAHKPEIIAGAFAVLLLLLLAAITLLVAARRNRSRENDEQAVFQSLPVWVAVVGRRHELLLHCTGTSVMSSAVRKNAEAVAELPAEFSALFAAKVDQVFASGLDSWLEFTCEGLHCRALFRRLSFGRKRHDAVIWVAADMDELYRSREEQGRLAERFRTTLESIGDAVIATDPKGVITLINPVAAHLLGIDAVAAIGRRAEDELKSAGADGASIRRLLDQVLHGGRPADSGVRVELAERDGRRYLLSAVATPLPDSDGGIGGAVLVFRDETAEVEQREQLLLKNTLLDNAAEIASIGYFYFGGKAKMTDIPVGDAFWAKRDGKCVPVEEWVIPEDVENLNEQTRRLRQGEIDRMEVTYASDYSGERRYYEERAISCAAIGGRPNEYLGVIMDITKRYRNKLRYQEASLLLKHILDFLPCSIFVKDFNHDNRYMMVNKQYAELHTLDAETMIGKTDFDLYPKERAERYCESDRRIIETGRAADSIEQLQLPDGAKMYVNVIKAKLPRINGKDLIVGVGMDVTELENSRNQLREANVKLIRAVEAAQEADRAKSSFLATISHELRTPLNAVIGFSELLQSEEMPAAERIETLKAIHLSGMALIKLINDVLDLSKIESEHLEIVRKPVDFQLLVDEIVHIFKPLAKNKRIGVESVVTDIPPGLLLDAMRLRQVLLNLTGNAVKFTEKGNVTLRAEFIPHGPHADSGVLKIAVGDSGIGIPPEDLEYIFKPFAQARRIRGKYAYEGTGLGLAISQRLVEKMGGRIHVESEVGVGSTFFLEFDPVVVGSPDVEAPPKPVMAPPRVKHAAADRKVMIVDDVPVNLTVLGAILKKLGVGFIACGSASAALNLLTKMKDESPVLIMTDLWMPEMDGRELAVKLAGNPATAGIPVVAVTADAQIEVGENDDVFSGLLLKPITMEKVRKLLENYIDLQ
jgi:PAS domain S-box-containing protein